MDRDGSLAGDGIICEVLHGISWGINFAVGMTWKRKFATSWVEAEPVDEYM